MEYVDLPCVFFVMQICFGHVMLMLHYTVIKHRVLIFCRGGRGGTRNMSGVILLLKFKGFFVPMKWCY